MTSDLSWPIGTVGMSFGCFGWELCRYAKMLKWVFRQNSSERPQNGIFFTVSLVSEWPIYARRIVGLKTESSAVILSWKLKNELNRKLKGCSIKTQLNMLGIKNWWCVSLECRKRTKMTFRQLSRSSDCILTPQFF